MREKTPQEYADELLKMYRANEKVINEIEEYQTKQSSSQLELSKQTVFEDGTGGIQVSVTTLNRLYPVKNAIVTVFTGRLDNITVVESGITDESGKSGIFNLKTPSRADSLQANGGDEIPYASYNVSVKSDGYVEQIAMNVPVFSGVVSVQGIDLLPMTAAGKHVSPQIFNEENKYNL